MVERGGLGDGAADPPSALGAADFDDLLREVLERVHGARRAGPLRLLLDAVVTMAADLSLDGCWRGSCAIAGCPGRRPVRRAGRPRHRARRAAADLRPPRHGRRGGRRDRRPAHRARAARPAHRPARAAPAARPRRHPASYGFPRAPPADALLPRRPGADPRPGLRQPLPDREGTAAATSPTRTSASSSRSRPPPGVAIENARLYEEAPTPRAVAGRDGGDHRRLLGRRPGRRRPAGRGRPGPGGRRAPTSPGSWPAAGADSPRPCRSSRGDRRPGGDA